MNIYALQDKDVVYYYYGNVELPDYGSEDAIAAVKITVNTALSDWDHELVGLPEPSEGWGLKLLGDVGDVITQAEFEEAVACHEVTYTDGDDTWTGIPLWYLAGAVDDVETSSHWTFNDTLAATNYRVKVIAADGYNYTFDSGKIAQDKGYIVANSLNGEPLDYLCLLKLVGSAVFGGNKIGNITEIDLVELITPPPATGSYNLNLIGKITDVLSQAEYETAADHGVNWTDPDTSDVWEGVPLWFFCGWVDDRIPHGPDGFNDNQAAMGYKIIVKAGDGYAKEFASADVARNGGFIVADTLNDEPLSQDGSHPPWPLRLVGSEVSGGSRVGNIVEIELTEFGVSTEVPSLHIIKYDMDGTTILNDKYWHYYWNDGVQYPSCAGLSAKYVDTIEIYSAHATGWNLTLEGAYNDTLAAAGYNITIIASDGYSVTIDSGDTIRNSNYIVANTLNGTHIPEDDSSWPLKLVGANVSDSLLVKGVATIKLDFLPAIKLGQK